MCAGDVTHSAGVQVGTDDRSGRAVKQDIVATWPRGIVPYRFDDSSGCKLYNNNYG